MVTEERQGAPYAPVANVLTVIRRFRERGLPDPLSFQELERIGIPTGNAPRTLAALRFLDLVDDEGQRMEAFENLGRATTDDYPEVLAEVVRAAYRPIFTVVDPAEDSEITLHDAFRHFHPQAQRGRMVTLFLGLCQEAGLVPGGPPQRRARVRRRQEPQSVPVAATTQPTKPEPIEVTGVVPGPTATQEAGADYRLVSALMQQLPKDGKWTRAKRDKWIEAVSASVDLLTDIVEDASNGPAPCEAP